jgi:hypothetical protein
VSAAAAIAAVLAGTVLFPALLPYLPVKDFSVKGLILGALIATPFAGYYAASPAVAGWAKVLGVVTPLLIMPAVTAFLALNFTGSTTFTSRTGVKKEIYRYIRLLAGMAALGTIAGVVLGVGHFTGVL